MPTQHSMRVQIWLPFVFAVLLSAMKVFAPNGAGDPAFFCFLPMCFLGVAQSQLALLRRLDSLKANTTPAMKPGGTPA